METIGDVFWNVCISLLDIGESQQYFGMKELRHPGAFPLPDFILLGASSIFDGSAHVSGAYEGARQHPPHPSIRHLGVCTKAPACPLVDSFTLPETSPRTDAWVCRHPMRPIRYRSRQPRSGFDRNLYDHDAIGNAV